MPSELFSLRALRICTAQCTLAVRLRDCSSQANPTASR